MNALRQFWFPVTSYFDLAVVRVLAVGLQLYLLVAIIWERFHYTLGLPDEMYNPLPVFQLLAGLFGTEGVPPEAVIEFVYWLTVIAGMLAFVGLFTNASLLLFAVGNIFLQSFIYSFGDYHHPEALMMIALLALSLSPAGRALSLDAKWWPKLGSMFDWQKAGAQSSPFAGWPLRMIQTFFALMYLSAVVSKLHANGFVWANGFTLQYYMVQDGVRWGNALAMWLAGQHSLLLVAQYVVLLMQATFWIVLFLPKARWLYIPLGLTFHIGIYMTLEAPFRQWIVLYAVFIPWATAARKFRDWRVSRLRFAHRPA